MNGWYVTGAWYDATAKRLYLAEDDGDWTRNREPRPMIHVFDIAA